MDFLCLLFCHFFSQVGTNSHGRVALRQCYMCDLYFRTTLCVRSIFFFSSNEKNKSLFFFVCLSFRFLTSHLLCIIHQTFCVMSECGSNQPAGIKEFIQKLCVKHFKHRSREKYFDLATQRLPPGGLPAYEMLHLLHAFFPQGFWSDTGFVQSIELDLSYHGMAL